MALLDERTVECHAWFLAAQLLNATVIPVNLAHPAPRVASMVSAANAQVLIGIPSRVSGTGTRVACDDESEIRGLRDDLSPTAPIPNGSVLLFTSGSTGRPKGVPLGDRQLVSHLEYVRGHGYDIGPGHRQSMNFDMSFDGGLFNMIAAWSAGACCYVAAKRDLYDPVGFVVRNSLTHWTSVPSLVTLAEQGRRLKRGSMPTLMRTVFGGEILTRRAAWLWSQAAHKSSVSNWYGPTELAVTVSIQDAEPDADANRRAGVVPIGQLHDTMERAIVDTETLSEASTGELCVRGPQRFDGYLAADDNVAAFYTGTPGNLERLVQGRLPRPDDWYRTGDLVSLDSGGVLHFLGRIDDQVKVRGFRIELAEVEEAARSLEGILTAVAVVERDVHDSHSLVLAYEGDPIDEQAALRQLALNQPPWMVPSRFQRFDVLPRNANGKVDRKGVTSWVQSGGSTPRGSTI